MILMHVSFVPVKKFKLRVPKGRADGEDSITPRICLSDDICKAITAKPGGGTMLRGMLRFRDDIMDITPLLHVYYCKTKNNPDIFIPSEILREKYNVLDAEGTHEWWATSVPQFTHKILKIEHAKCRDAEDDFGHTMVIVDDIQTSILKKLPSNAPELALKHSVFSPFTLSQVFYTTDQRKYVTP